MSTPDTLENLIEVRAILAQKLNEARDKRDNLQAKYEELLYAVSKKHPGETRHETALRYIRQAEAPVLNDPAKLDNSEHKPL